MSAIRYRPALDSDIPAMALLRSAEWGDEKYWRDRIAAYMTCELDPQHALKPRVLFAAMQGDALIGFIAGHLTSRYNCDGELEWINVDPTNRRTRIASDLLRLLAYWFAENNARRVCVDVDPKNLAARRFYTKLGATELNRHWLVWDDISLVVTDR